jgi:RNA polymerase sigma-70 factor (ECF subfamily)
VEATFTTRREPDAHERARDRERCESDAQFERRLADHAPAVAALLRRHSRSADLRHDALQETLVRAWRARDRYDPRRPFGPWLATIALRVARDLERGRRRRRDDASLDELGREETTSGDPLLELAHRDEHARLEQALARLDDTPRRVLLLFHREQLAVQEIASTLGMPVNTVKSHLRRARIALAKALGGANR